MKNLILYFTGTGNSLEIAKNIASGIENCHIKNLIVVDPNIEITEYDSIGFIYPCYMMGTPSFIKDKIIALNLPKTAYYYGIVTAGMKDSWGTGYQLMEILEGKGCKLSSFNTVQMARNYVMLYDPLSKEKAKELSKIAKSQCKLISEFIVNRDVEEIKENKVWLSNLAKKIGGNKNERKDLDFISTDNCDGCGLCTRVCKFDNVKLNASNKPEWQGNCVHCTACIQWCPRRAIEYGKKTRNRSRYTNSSIKASEL